MQWRGSTLCGMDSDRTPSIDVSLADKLLALLDER